MINRLVKPSKSSSFFLFGARGTGKTTFINEQFLSNNYLKFDLLNPDIEEEFSRYPMHLYQQIEASSKLDWIFIDEVQKIPKLLNVVHKCIEDLKVRFILTGSSSRKLKRGGANLLAGRAFLYSLFPFTHLELNNDFLIESILRWGSLPKTYELKEDSDKKRYLKTYAQVYLKEEIKEEQLVRQIDPFREFLEVSAQMSGKIVNFSKIARNVGVDYKTVQTYFDILNETYIGFYLPTFHQSVRKSQTQSPKFYYFDLGVKNSLAKVLDSIPTPGNSFYGEQFEHFVIQEVFRWNHYFDLDFRLSFMQTKNKAEIDLILSRGKSIYAIEIKSDDAIDTQKVRKLRTLAGDIKNITAIYYVSRHSKRRMIEGVVCCHWLDFFVELPKFSS